MGHDGGCHKQERQHEKALKLQYIAPAATCLLQGSLKVAFPARGARRLLQLRCRTQALEAAGNAHYPFIKCTMLGKPRDAQHNSKHIACNASA